MNQSSDRLNALKEIVFPVVVAAVRRIHQPAMRSLGFRVVSQTGDFGTIVTSVDLRASDVILNGLPDEKIVGLAAHLPGSFSEEADNPSARQNALDIWVVDPMDGSGDAKKLGISPTVLVTRFERKTISWAFRPTSALIYDVVGDYAIMTDGREVCLGQADQSGEFRGVPLERRSDVLSDQIWRAPRRLSYPQKSAHTIFPAFFLAGTKIGWEGIEAGGAGLQSLQFIKRLVKLVSRESCPAFDALWEIDLLANFQPDWKIWDTGPMRVFATAFGLPKPVDIYGAPLDQDVDAPSLAQMVHKRGCIFAMSEQQLEKVTGVVHDFENLHGKSSLLVKDY